MGFFFSSGKMLISFAYHPMLFYRLISFIFFLICRRSDAIGRWTYCSGFELQSLPLSLPIIFWLYFWCFHSTLILFPFTTLDFKLKLESLLLLQHCNRALQCVHLIVVNFSHLILWSTWNFSCCQLGGMNLTMLSNCGAGEEYWESLGLQGDETSES